MIQRRVYVDLVESVRDNGGDVKVFSSLHVSGERKYSSHSILDIRLFYLLEDHL